MEKSLEQLTHFNCDECEKWWSISDVPSDKLVWYCPWCGNKHEEEAAPLEAEEEDLGEMDQKLTNEINKLINILKSGY